MNFYVISFFSVPVVLFWIHFFLMWRGNRKIRKNLCKEIEGVRSHLSEISYKLEEIKINLFHFEVRISNQMNGKFSKLEEREREVAERVMCLEYKKDLSQEMPRKRGRPRKY